MSHVVAKGGHPTFATFMSRSGLAAPVRRPGPEPPGECLAVEGADLASVDAHRNAGDGTLR